MTFGISTWFIWAIVLIIQNFAFTFVSRARNSGSLRRHMIASIFSNGVWFLSQIIIFEQLYKVMKGDYGVAMAAFTAVFYTAFTMTGSLVSHYWALRNEKGKARIGSYKDVATFTKEEGDALRELIKREPYFIEGKYSGTTFGRIVPNMPITGKQPPAAPPIPGQGAKL